MLILFRKEISYLLNLVIMLLVYRFIFFGPNTPIADAHCVCTFSLSSILSHQAVCFLLLSPGVQRIFLLFGGG